MAATVRLAALVATAIVAIGFIAFATDELRRGSETQIRRIGAAEAAPAPTAAAERSRERAHGPLREALDDANDFLLAPFSGIVGTRDAWIQRAVPTALALLVYGFGLGMLANSLPGPRPRGDGDWRTAA